MSDHVRSGSKAGPIVRIVIWTIVLAITVSALALCYLRYLDFPNWSFNIGDYGFKIGNYTYNDADYNVGDADITQVIRSLRIDWINGTVSILPGDEDTLTIRETPGTSGITLSTDDQLRWRLDDGVLDIRYCRSYTPVFRWNATQADKNLEVIIPASWLETPLEELNLNVVSAHVTATDISVAHLDADSVSGGLEISLCNRPQEVSMTSVSGHMTLTAAACISTVKFNSVSGKIHFKGDAQTIDVDTTSGGIELCGAFDEVNIDTVSGRMELSLTAPAREISLDSTSGSATLYLPSDIPGFKVDYDGNARQVSLDGFRTSIQGGHITYGNESTKIDMDSVSGSLTIRAWDPLPTTTSDET